MATTDISKRMRLYEEPFNQTLPQRMPIMIRVDGKAFHTFCTCFEKPWDSTMRRAMDAAARALCEEAMGARCAYVQSDEITVLLTPYKKFGTQPWFGGRVSKIVSVAASIVTRAFNLALEDSIKAENMRACFDARAFVVPREDVTNAFVERQQDAIRNSVQMLAQAHFSHRELQGKSIDTLEDMLLDRGIIWADAADWQKYGRFFTRETYEVDGSKRSHWSRRKKTPIFTTERAEIDRFVWPKDEEGI